jgi:hypothetical protein
MKELNVQEHHKQMMISFFVEITHWFLPLAGFIDYDGNNLTKMVTRE